MRRGGRGCRKRQPRGFPNKLCAPLSHINACFHGKGDKRVINWLTILLYSPASKRQTRVVPVSDTSPLRAGASSLPDERIARARVRFRSSLVREPCQENTEV